MPLRTKQQILEERQNAAAKVFNNLTAQVEDETPFGHPCTGCGKILETEKDFRSHFLIPDERYLNLGECPDKVKVKVKVKDKNTTD